MSKAVFYETNEGQSDDCTASASGTQWSFVDASSLPSANIPVDYVTFGGSGIDLLDSNTIFADSTDKFGFLSHTVGVSGTAAATVTFAFGSAYTTSGITVRFWQDYCPFTAIYYFMSAGTEIELIRQSYTPDQLNYYAPLTAKNYTKIVLQFYPVGDFAKFYAVDFGRVVETTQITDISILEEVDVTCSDVPINQLDLSVRLDSPLNFAYNRAIEIYDSSNNLIGKYREKTVAHAAEDKYTFMAQDDMSIADESVYTGKMLRKDDMVYETIYLPSVISELEKAAGIRIELDPSYSSTVLYGFIPYGSPRKALMQIAFAIGALVDTSRNDHIRIFPRNSTLSSTIGANRIIGNARIEAGNKVSSVSVTSHDYTKSWDQSYLYTAFDGDAGTDTLVPFKDASWGPYSHDGLAMLEITPTYARVSGNGKLKIYKYADGQTTRNIDISKTATSNISEYKDYTLVSQDIISNPLSRLSGLLRYPDKIYATIIMAAEKPGDTVRLVTPYDGTYEGVITAITLRPKKSTIGDVTISYVHAV